MFKILGVAVFSSPSVQEHRDGNSLEETAEKHLACALRQQRFYTQHLQINEQVSPTPVSFVPIPHFTTKTILFFSSVFLCAASSAVLGFQRTFVHSCLNIRSFYCALEEYKAIKNRHFPFLNLKVKLIFQLGMPLISPIVCICKFLHRSKA